METYIEYMEKICSSLPDIKEPLELALKDSGPVFEQIGMGLQSVYSDAVELAALNIEAAGMADGESGADSLGQMSVLANSSLGMLESFRVDVNRGIENVEISANHLVRLHGLTPVIKRISKTLNIVALNIAMESSRSEECERMFSFFVSEIRTLTRKVNSISQDMHEDAADAYQKQITAFREISNQKSQLATVADSAHEVVQDSISKIEQLITSSLNAIKMAGVHSGKISKQVGEVVVAIQFHDIARQQIEHVMKAFEDVEHLCEKGTDHSLPEKDRMEILGRVRSILDLQGAQVNHVSDEIGTVHEKIAVAFDEIYRESEQLVKRVTSIGLFEGCCSGSESYFYDLLSGLERLNHIMIQGQGMADKIRGTMLDSSETVSRLSDHIKQIEGISMDLHIKAINAVLMSMRLGKEGRTLAILAQGVTEVSKESNEFATEVVNIIRTISGIADELKCLTHNNEEGLNNDKLSMISLTQGVENISRYYEHFKECTSESIRRSGELKKKISGIETDLSFFDEFKRQLKNCSERIDASVRLLKPFSLEKTDDLSGLDHVTVRYTMESERDIHERTLARKKGLFEPDDNRRIKKEPSGNNDFSSFQSVKFAESNQADPGEENEFDDNIELF